MVGIRNSVGKGLTKSRKLSFFNKPKYVYIPMISGRDTNITMVVKKGDYVYRGSIVGKRRGNFKIPIYSSVSGIVVDIVEKPCITGEKVKCVMIENDFKESVEESYTIKQDINDYTKDEFIKVLNNCGLIGLGGAGFPTYAKYDTEKEIKTLIVNGVECEPYITTDIVLLKERPEEILEAIDAIMNINNIREAYLAISKDSKLTNKVENFLGTYPRIKLVLVPNRYPMGWERNLIKYVKKTIYDRLPIEKGIVVNNVSTIYSVYSALKYNKPLFERVVTFTGEVLKKPQNVCVKVGTQVKDVIEHIEGYKRHKDLVIVAGGPMMGTSIVDDELVITPDLNCVMVIKKPDECRSIECLRCGKCVEKCPSHLSPVLIKNSINNIDELKRLKPEKCVECGLCSFICPSKINVREYVREAKSKLAQEGK